MRAIFIVVLFVASSGMIYAGVTADAPIPGIDYDIKTAVQDSCNPEATRGDRLLRLVSSGGNRSEAALDAPGNSVGRLLQHMTCGLLDF